MAALIAGITEYIYIRTVGEVRLGHFIFLFNQNYFRKTSKENQETKKIEKPINDKDAKKER